MRLAAGCDHHVTERVLGTEQFLAPECLTSRRCPATNSLLSTLSRATDIWAAGALLVHLLQEGADSPAGPLAALAGLRVRSCAVGVSGCSCNDSIYYLVHYCYSAGVARMTEKEWVGLLVTARDCLTADPALRPTADQLAARLHIPGQ